MPPVLLNGMGPRAGRTGLSGLNVVPDGAYVDFTLFVLDEHGRGS